MRRRDPMSAGDGFVVGFLILATAAQLAVGDWEDALDGGTIALFYFLWSNARRRVDFLERLLGAKP